MEEEEEEKGDLRASGEHLHRLLGTMCLPKGLNAEFNKANGSEKRKTKPAAAAHFKPNAHKFNMRENGSKKTQVHTHTNFPPERRS